MNSQTISVSILGDGNCLFRCLSYSIFSSQEYHYIIRLVIVEFIVDNWDNFKDFVCGEGIYDKIISNDVEYYDHLSQF